MVGYLPSPIIEKAAPEETKDSKIQPLLDSKQSSLPNYSPDLCLPELDDFNSFSEFVDFDALNSWLIEGDQNMADLVGKPSEFGLVIGEVGAPKESFQVLGSVEEDLSCSVKPFGDLEQEKCGVGVVERDIEITDATGVSEKVTVHGILSANETGETSADFGCLIEEQLGKVSLDGAKYIVELSEIGENGINVQNDSEVTGGNKLESCEIINHKEENTGNSGEGCHKGDVMVVNENASEEEESESESDSESEISSSASSSSSSDDEDDEEEDQRKDSRAVNVEKKAKNKKGKVGEDDVEEGEITLSGEDEMVAWGDDEDDVDAMTGPIKSKNELKDLPPVPPVTATLEPHHQTLPVGVVLSIMGAQVVVEGIEKHNPLHEGSILWITQSRSPLGIVDEIFGPVKNPYYVVRYNKDSEVPTGIEQGTSISFVTEFANHVLNDKSLYQKGYDASNENDEELSDELEFSDDEKEAQYKRMLKMKKRGTNESNKLGKKRNEKRQFNNQNPNWSGNNSPIGKNSSGRENLPIPPVSASLNKENYSGSSNMEQGLSINHPMVPPFPFSAPSPNFGDPNGIWCQPQSMGFPSGMPANAMPWIQQNQPNQLFQTPLPPPGMMPQQPMNAIPGFPGNLNSFGGLPNFCGPQQFAPWAVGLDPNMLGQLQFGMGMQAQPASMPLNTGGGQTGPFGGSQISQNNYEASPVSSGNFNPGRGGGGRRGGYRRGRGRGGGGRGRN